jgi:hypothetical protein
VNWLPINIEVTSLCYNLVWVVYVWLTLYATRRRKFGVKVETDKPEDLKKALLNSGISSDAEKINAHYTREVESF